MKRLAQIEDTFSGAFARCWERASQELTASGFILGACVRNNDGKLFRLTTIEPDVYNFGDPLASINCHGVLCRADGTWGSHKHWVGRLADLVAIEGFAERSKKKV